MKKLYSKEKCESKIAKWEERLKDFKEELIVGQWYKIDGNADYLINYNVKELSYGIYKGEWRNSMCFDTHHEMNSVLATDKEVQQALEKEAVKIGFKEGVTIKAFNNCKGVVQEGFEFYVENNCFYITKIKDHEDNYVDDLLGRYTIFKDGVWAEIIKEPVYEYQWFRKDINEVTPKFYVEKLSCFGMRIEENQKTKEITKK